MTVLISSQTNNLTFKGGRAKYILRLAYHAGFGQQHTEEVS